MLHSIREVMRLKGNEKLCNVTEIDEVYIGGKVPNMSKSKRKGKICSPVIRWLKSGYLYKP